MNKQIVPQSAKVIPHPAWVLRQRIPQIAPHIEHCPKCGIAIHSQNELQANRFWARHTVKCMTNGDAA
jgi:hypothetical protein